jgi:hypothetical protein
MCINPFRDIFKTNDVLSNINNFRYVNNALKSEECNILNNKNIDKIDINYDIYNSIGIEQLSQKNLDFKIESNNKPIAPTKASTRFDKSFDNKIDDYESMKNSSNNFYQDSIKEENDEPNFHELKSNLIIKKKKVGRKRKLDYEDNHKITNDNMIRKCKHLVINNCIEFLNFQIKKIYHNNIGEGILIKKILDINQIQKSDNKLESTKLFLNKKLSEIFSVDISSKYTSFLPDHNKILISRLLNEEDIEKREKFQKIFNLTFADCIQLFLGNNNKYIEFEGFPVLDEIKDELNEDNEYLEKIKNFLLNFEDIIKHKKPRKRNKKESSEININKDNLNQA